MLKGILVIIDGLGDLPCRLLGDKTPLEAAAIPNMDFLAARGELGYMYPVKPAYVPGSGEALFSIFGNNPIGGVRGQLEARGTGIKLVHGDLAIRVNFATIDNLKDGNILDRRAGRTLIDSEIEDLSRALNEIKLPCDFVFKQTLNHRAVLVLRGGFSDNISSNDAVYRQGKFHDSDKTKNVRALDEEENTQHTANIVNEFLIKAHEILKNHPVNLNRKKKGLMLANYLLTRSSVNEELKLKQYRNWLAFTYTPITNGFAEASGMKIFSFDYPKFKGVDAYGNFYEGLNKACKLAIKTIKKNYKNFDYAYIHLRETDNASHDNKPIEKKIMIEHIDSVLFRFLRKFAPYNKIKVVVTGDHSTPCKFKNHTADPVPVLFYNDSIPREKHFNEKEARLGKLGRMNGGELFEKTFFGKVKD